MEHCREYWYIKNLKRFILKNPTEEELINHIYTLCLKPDNVFVRERYDNILKYLHSTNEHPIWFLQKIYSKKRE